MKHYTFIILSMLIALSTTKASTYEYFFENFEIDNSWVVGLIPQQDLAVFEVIQGAASVKHVPEDNSSQILELEVSDPFTAVLLDASQFNSYEIIYCEMLVKPSVMTGLRDEEFLNFDGAILGFFGDRQEGQIKALSSKNEDESVWISTGINYPLNAEGSPEEWIQIRIRIDTTSQRWSLALNDEWILKDLKMMELSSAIPLPLMLYGHVDKTNQFDDLLISNLPPIELENELINATISRNKYTKPSNTTTEETIVSKVKSNENTRHQVEAIQNHKSSGSALQINKITSTLNTNTNSYTTDTNKKTPLILYSPSYDAEGNKNAALLKVKADTHLEPGVKLRNLKWSLVHWKGGVDEYGKTLAVGDFRTGLVQEIIIKPAWQEFGIVVLVEVHSE